MAKLMRQFPLWVLSAGLVAVSFAPADAITVQQMRQRINNTVATNEQLLAASAEKIICKGQKKPICYAEGIFVDSGFALVRVTRPEDEKAYYIVYQNKPEGWMPMYSRTMDLLSLAKWKADKVAIPDPVANRLIQKMLPLR